MSASSSAQIALLAFATAIVAGLGAGNAPETILSRALGVLVVAWLVGQLASAAANRVLGEHLTARKIKLDRAHLDEIERAKDETPVEAQPQAE